MQSVDPGTPSEMGASLGSHLRNNVNKAKRQCRDPHVSRKCRAARIAQTPYGARNRLDSDRLISRFGGLQKEKVSDPAVFTGSPSEKSYRLIGDQPC